MGSDLKDFPGVSVLKKEKNPPANAGATGPHSQGFGIVNKAEIDIFLELSSFFDDPADVDNLISGSSAFSKTSLNIWKFMVYVLLKPSDIIINMYIHKIKTV